MKTVHVILVNQSAQVAYHKMYKNVKQRVSKCTEETLAVDTKCHKISRNMAHINTVCIVLMRMQNEDTVQPFLRRRRMRPRLYPIVRVCLSVCRRCCCRNELILRP